MNKAETNATYMIKAGKGAGRKLLISAPDYCYVLFRHKGSKISLWSEGLTGAEGRELIKKYLVSNKVFLKELKNLRAENIHEGSSEYGGYTKEEFKELLNEYFDTDYDDTYGLIYDALLSDNTDGIVSLRSGGKSDDK